MKPFFLAVLTVFVLLSPSNAWTATIDEVTFLTKVQTYEAAVDTVLMTQEGKRTSISKGTKLNVAGFTKTEALVLSRKDRPNGFVKKADIVPAKR